MRTAWFLLLLASTAPGQDLQGLFTPAIWERSHSDLKTAPGGLEVLFHKGYEATGFSTTRLAVRDWSRSGSLRFEVDNPQQEPLSVFVRLSNREDHPRAETYTGGTFDGFVIGPGRSTVEISLENMKSPEQKAIDPSRIAWLGIEVQPLFLRDGQDLRFTRDTIVRFSNPRLDARPAALQKQPYADLLFRETDPSVAALRRETEQALASLDTAIGQAKAKGVETAYAEIYPFLAKMAFNSRLVAFWQNRADLQRDTLLTLRDGARTAEQQLQRHNLTVPPVPDYEKLVIRDGYFRDGDRPALIFGMLYNQRGPLLRWFANSQTDYGTELVAGGTRHDVERQPIWKAYHEYPDTHRVGWPHADHIIRDSSSWEVLGDPVNVCLESPHSRDAIAQMIETYERAHANDRRHLVQNMGFEYTYVCYCDYTKRMWTQWLERKHKDIGAANRAWGTQYADFASVPMLHPEQFAANRGLWFDWASFNLHRFLEQIRWTRDQIRRWEPAKPLTVGSPYFAFDPTFWTGVDEEELADSGITGVVLEENYQLDTLMPEYLHALAGGKPVADFEYHGVIHQILPSFLHGDAAISMWWWNENKHWTPNEPINEWTTSFPQSYTIPLRDVAKVMRDSLDLRRLAPEIAALGSAPRQVALLYSRTSMLQDAEASVNLRRVYNASQSAGLYVGLTTEKKIDSGALGAFKVLVLPGAQYIGAAPAKRILEWVANGGTLIVSPDSMLADEYTRPLDTPAALGIRVASRQPPPLKRGETVVTEYNVSDLPRMPFSFGGQRFAAAGGRQIVKCKDPSYVAARFADGSPALLRIPRGKGVVYWLASPVAPESWEGFLAAVAAGAGIERELRVSNPSVEYRVTKYGGRRLAYLYNNSDADTPVTMTPEFPVREIIDRRTETSMQRSFTLPARETAIVEFR